MSSGEVPARIGELEIIRRIGAGGFGVVYLATDRRLGRNVAVKLVHPGRGDLRREARAAARLAHPNVVTIYEIGEHEGSPYLAMEYVDGPTLRERLAQGRLARFEALRIARDLAAAIAAAHREGIVHLDLTPANVLLARDGRARVVDFGLARASEAPHAEGFTAGTPGFMAPEQWRGESLGAPADVWALGAVVHVLLTGVPLFDGSSEQLRERVAGPAAIELSPVLAEAPAELVEVVRRCLRKDPAARPDAAELASALDAYAQRPDAGPFRGLDAYDAGTAAEFRGRDDATAAVLELVRRERAVTITGASGCGKSSLLHAGVIPALRAEGWKVAVVRPGRRPLAAIASALRSTIPGAATQTRDGAQVEDDDLEDRAARWAESPERFAADLAGAAAAVGERCVLVIDQLEEITDVAERDRALAAIAGATAFHFILSVRADLEVRPLGHAYTLALPDRARLETILEPPLGYRFEDGLAATILDDIAGEPGALVLLQLVGTALWERRDRERRVITRRAYTELGGAAGILATHVRSFLAGCTRDEATLARSLLSRCGGALATEPMLERLIAARIVIARADDFALAHRELVLDDEPSRDHVLQRSMTRRRRMRVGPWLGIGAGIVMVSAFALAPAHTSQVEGDGIGECSSFAFPQHELATAFNANGVQDAVNAISEDGHSIASYRRDCNQPVFTALVIDDLGGEVATLDLATVPALAGTVHSDGYITMSSDALTVIVADRDRRGFLAARRSARGASDFRPTNDLMANIRVAAPAVVIHPAISPDGLAFYYTVRGSVDPGQNGIYESLRFSTALPFPTGTQLPPNIQTADYITGISRDRLTVFIQSGYTVLAYARRSLDEPFVNPRQPIQPPVLPGFRTRPFAGCTKLIGTCINGCNGEDSCVFSR